MTGAWALTVSPESVAKATTSAIPNMKCLFIISPGKAAQHRTA
jgi:hypothetical protein